MIHVGFVLLLFVCNIGESLVLFTPVEKFFIDWSLGDGYILYFFSGGVVRMVDALL